MAGELAARDCRALIGLTVGEVIAALGIRAEGWTVFHEPPAVGRGLVWAGPDGLHVQIWVARREGLFRLPLGWEAAEFFSRRAVGIIVTQHLAPLCGAADGRPPNNQPPRVREWWAGGSRFSFESQRADAEPGVAPDPAPVGHEPI